MKILNYRIVTFASVCLIAGIFCGRFMAFNILISIIVPLAVVAGGILLTVITKKLTFVIILTAAAVGMAASVIDVKEFGADEYNCETYMEGRVSGSYGEGKLIAEEIIVNGEEAKGKAIIKCGKNYPVGTKIKVYGEIRTYRTDITDSYSASLYCDRIYYEVKAETVISAEIGELKTSEKLKTKMTAAIEKYMTSENAGVMKSLLFGDKTGLDESDGEAINGIGLAHIFAVSGLHIGFLAALFTMILRKLKLRREIILIIVIGVLIMYGTVTGFPSGVKRASIMLIISMSGKIAARKNDTLTSLSLSAAIITLTNPRELFDLGFIMSFAAVLGIICFYKPICRAMTKYVKNKAAVYTVKLIATTISANIFILPIMFNVFGKFSVYAPFANLLILPIISVIFPIAALTAILCLIWQGFGVMFYIIGYVIGFIRYLSAVIYSMPYSEIEVPGMGIATVIYVAAFIVASPYITAEKKYKYSFGGALGITAIILAAVL